MLIKAEDISYVSLESKEVGLVPAIVAFVDTVKENVPAIEEVFTIENILIDQDRQEWGLVQAYATEDDDADPVEIELPLSYLSLLTAFAYSPTPMELHVFDLADRPQYGSYEPLTLTPQDSFLSMRLAPAGTHAFDEILESVTEAVSTSRSAPMEFNLRKVYSPYYETARAALFRHLVDIAHGRTNGLEAVYVIASEAQRTMERTIGQDATKMPQTFFGEDLKSHDAFLEGYLHFLSTAYQSSLLAIRIDDDMDSDEYSDEDRDFIDLMQSSGLMQKMEKIDMEQAGENRTYSSHLVYPVTPEWPVGMEPVRDMLLSWDNPETIVKTLDKPKLQESLSLDSPETLINSIITMELLIASRAYRTTEAVYHMDDMIATIVSTISHYINDSDVTDLWEFKALASKIVDYDLEAFRELLRSTASADMDIDDFKWLHVYGLSIIVFFLNNNFSPGKLTEIISQTEVKTERRENFTTLVSDYLMKFGMVLEQANQELNPGEEVGKISISTQDIINYSLHYFHSMLEEYEEQPDILVGLEGEKPGIQTFFAEVAYQFSYVLPLLSDVYAQSQNTDIGSAEWKEARRTFVEQFIIPINVSVQD